MLVPDSFPDILRILDSGRKVCLISKEWARGIDLAGFAKMELLYMLKGIGVFFRLDMNIPFQYPVEFRTYNGDVRKSVYRHACKVRRHAISIAKGPG